MGRGRAKAKQTKVARELKYHSGGMDLDRLRDELVTKPSAGSDSDSELDSYAADTDEYAGDDEYEDDEDDDEPLPSRRAASR